MKKVLIPALFALLMSFGLVGVAAAQSNELIYKGKLTYIGTSRLTVSSTTIKNYTVAITSNTDLLRKTGEVSSLSEFSLSDNVRIKGTWNDTKSEFNATEVKNLSIKKSKKTIGTIKLRANDYFVLEYSRLGRKYRRTIILSPATRFVSKSDNPMTYLDFREGQVVSISAGGIYNSTHKKIFNVSLIKNRSE